MTAASTTVHGAGSGRDVTVITLPTTTADAIAAAITERNAGFAQADEADRTGWDKNLIDQAIRALAQTGLTFSANDLRELLPDVRTSLMGSRFNAARLGGIVRCVGEVRSTKKNTHAKRISAYVGQKADQ